MQACKFVSRICRSLRCSPSAQGGCRIRSLKLNRAPGKRIWTTSAPDASSQQLQASLPAESRGDIDNDFAYKENSDNELNKSERLAAALRAEQDEKEYFAAELAKAQQFIAEKLEAERVADVFIQDVAHNPIQWSLALKTTPTTPSRKMVRSDEIVAEASRSKRSHRDVELAKAQQLAAEKAEAQRMQPFSRTAEQERLAAEFAKAQQFTEKEAERLAPKRQKHNALPPLRSNAEQQRLAAELPKHNNLLRKCRLNGSPPKRQKRQRIASCSGRTSRTDRLAAEFAKAQQPAAEKQRLNDSSPKGRSTANCSCSPPNKLNRSVAAEFAKAQQSAEKAEAERLAELAKAQQLLVESRS